MRLALPLHKARGSSARWVARQASDPYVRNRASPTNASTPGQTFRARSAFKLVSLAERYPALLSPGRRVVDLGAAPGGWSQVAASRVGAGAGAGASRVVAVDISAMMPIKGVVVIKGDFLDGAVQDEVRKALGAESGGDAGAGHGHGGGRVDTVLSDMMAPMSGLRDRDIQASLDLVGAATFFARRMLKRGTGEMMPAGGSGKKVYDGGSLVMKFFAHPDLVEFQKTELDGWFARVFVDKPKESRSESSEAFFVCLGFKGDPARPSPSRDEGDGSAEADRRA